MLKMARKGKNKDKSRKTKVIKLNKHHILPSSRGGTNALENLALIQEEKHQAYHYLFENKTPDEIINDLVRNYWSGQRVWVDRYYVKMRRGDYD